MAQINIHKSHNRYLRVAILRNFFALALISFAFVAGIAVLAQAELKLSGDIVNADGDYLELLFGQDVVPIVHKIADRTDIRLYLISQRDKQFLAHAEKNEHGEWEIVKVERVHRN